MEPQCQDWALHHYELGLLCGGGRVLGVWLLGQVKEGTENLQWEGWGSPQEEQ